MKHFLAMIFSSTNGGSSDSGAMDSLKNMLTNPILYIVLGAIVLIIVTFYLFRRYIKARPNSSTIIVRGGKVYKVVDESNPSYYMVPFKDHFGVIITDSEKEFSSDKLFINNGPDALYKINYSLKYKVINPKEFYPYIDTLANVLPVRLNDELRLFADQGNALLLVKDYRQNEKKILEVVNKAVSEFYIEVISFKINVIEPIGRQ